jgi:hypothetical protein
VTYGEDTESEYWMDPHQHGPSLTMWTENPHRPEKGNGIVRGGEYLLPNHDPNGKYTACSFGWWLMAGAGLF